MPRAPRCILPGVPYHITQRGVDRRYTFFTDTDRTTYLNLWRENLSDASVRILAWCLMTNHVHVIAVPGRQDSLAVAARRVHGRYAQYFNALYGRTGHLWQNRYFACALAHSHLWRAIAYVERNPVRAGLVARAEDYPWSSAGAHQHCSDETGLLEPACWHDENAAACPRLLTHTSEDSDTDLRRCTYAGRPYGDEGFVQRMSERFGRYWQRGRSRRRDLDSRGETEPLSNQLPLWI
jgi:putative transposase